MTERFHLRFESGDRRGETVPVPRAGLLIGRREGNDLLIADASVSGRHALVRPTDDGLAVEDLGSTNGTHVAGSKIQRGTVEPGQTLRVGKVEFVVVDTSATPTDAEPAPGDSDGAEPPVEDEIRIGDAPLLEDEIDLGGGAAGGVPAARVPAGVPARPAAPAPAPAPAADGPSRAAAEDDASELHTIDQSALERSRSRRGSPWITVAVVALLVAGAGLAAYLLLGGDESDGDGAVVGSPRVVPNNLLAGGDLEGADAEELLATEGAGGRFLADRVYAATGQVGLGITALAGSSVRAATPTVRVRPGQALAAAATVAVDAEATARVGLELADSTGGRLPLTFWSTAPAPDSTERLEARADVPPGFDRARLLVAAGDARTGRTVSEDDDAEAVGDIGVDDLAIAPTDEPTATVVAVGDFEVRVAEPARDRLLLAHIGDALLTATVADEDDLLAPSARLALEAGTAGTARVTFDGGAARLVLDARPALVGEGARDLATTGDDGYRARSGEFSSSGVEALVLGQGVRLVRVVFDAPVAVHGRERAGRQRLEVDLGEVRGLTLQLSFQRELEAANVLATRARSAQRDGRYGDVFALWDELLRDYPYDENLVREADARRAELIAAGLEELGAVEDELERARFFALTGIYDRCAAAAEAIVDRYRPTEGGRASEVLNRATELLAAIRAEREGLASARSGGEPARQRAILGWLERNAADDLARRLREAVDG